MSRCELRVELGERAPASYGISTYPQDGVDRDGLHQQADLALYAAKHAGRDRAVLYEKKETHGGRGSRPD